MVKLLRHLSALILPALFLFTIPAHAGKLLWSDKDPLRRIARAELDGSNVEDVLVGSEASAWAMTADAGSRKVFWTTLGDVWSANLDGSDAVKLRDDSNWFGFDVEFDQFNDAVYWTSYSGDDIERIDTNGANYQLILSSRDEPAGLALDAGQGKMYWGELGETNTLFRANLNGTNIQVVLTGVEPRVLEIDDASGKLYWITPGVSIQRASLAGTNLETIVGNGSIVGQYIELDTVNGHIYWTDDESRIYRADLDGSNMTIVVDGLDDLRPIAVVPLSFCGDGQLDAGEACDDGNQVPGDGCQSNCVLSICGDGILDVGEECDDGNNDDGDGCSGDCTLPCGDGVIDPGEECDDGNNVDGDGCQGNCVNPFCGDGIVDAGEQCDDGNDLDFDGCQSDCTLSPDSRGSKFNWAGSFSSGGWFGSRIAVDTAGVTTVVICFQGSIDADPGPDVLTIVSDGGVRNTLVSRIDPQGDLLSAGVLRGDDVCARDVVADDLGNTYLVGFFDSVADVDPGPGVFELTTGSVDDGFAVKLGPDGSLLWASQTAGGGGMISATAHGGTLFALGNASDGTDIDPGPATQSLPYAGRFVWALGGSGELIWAQNLGDEGSSLPATAIGSAAGALVVTGRFFGPSDFDPGPGTEIYDGGCSSIYVISLQSIDGVFNWARVALGPPCSGDTAQSSEPFGVDVDSRGRIHVGGSYDGVVDFDPGPGSLILDSGGFGSRQGFLWSLDALGNLRWLREVRTIAGPFADNGVAGVGVDELNHIYTQGTFRGTVEIAPGLTLTAAGFNDAFIIKYDADGGVVWSGTFSGALPVYGGDLDTRAPSVYLTGSFYGIADFDPGSGIANQEAVGEFQDAYVVKLTPVDGPPVPALGGLAALLLVLTMLGAIGLLRR